MAVTKRNKPKIVKRANKQATPTSAAKLQKKTRSKPKTKKLPSRRSILLGTRSTWINFISTKRKQLGSDAPKSFGELCKQLSGEWHAMTQEQKQPYVDMYEKDRDRYQRDKASLTEENRSVLRAIRRKGRVRRNANRPKPALSAYMFFVKCERRALAECNPSMTFEQIGGELGRRWRALTDDARAPFAKMSDEDKKRHAVDLATMTAAK